MKKTACFIFSMVALSSLAQVKQVAFDQKLTYKIEVENAQEDYLVDYSTIKYDHYIGKNKQESLLSFYYTETSGNSSEANLYIKDEWMVPMTVNGISQTVSYTPYSAFKFAEEGKVLSKIDRSGTFKGIDCEYYAFLSNVEDKTSYDACFCIDENNKIDNAGILLPESTLKGLIVAAEDSRDEKFRLIYESSENIQLTLDLDAEKMIADVEAYHNKQNEYDEVISMTEYAAEAPLATSEFSNLNTIYSDPLFSYGTAHFDNYDLYNYVYPVYGITSNLLYNTKEYSENTKYTREQVAKFYKKSTKNLVKDLASSKIISSEEKKMLNNFFNEKNKEIEKYRPDAPPAPNHQGYTTETTADVDYDAYYSFYTKYESVYSGININEVSLAYDILDGDSLKVNAPEYCDDLKNRIPEFQNKDLKLHVYNLAGQICDLYLYNNGGYVGYFETINSMRKSFLEIEKMRNSLSKKDQKALLEYLISLD